MKSSMKILKPILLTLLLAAFFPVCASGAEAGGDKTISRLIEAVKKPDLDALEKLLSPDFWFIGAGGHLKGKEAFIQEFRDRRMVVDQFELPNLKEKRAGDTRFVTSNGVFRGVSKNPKGQGLIRFTIAIVGNGDNERITLLQATPIIPNNDCKDRNCK